MKHNEVFIFEDGSMYSRIAKENDLQEQDLELGNWMAPFSEDSLAFGMVESFMIDDIGIAMKRMHGQVITYTLSRIEL